MPSQFFRRLRVQQNELINADKTATQINKEREKFNNSVIFINTIFNNISGNISYNNIRQYENMLMRQ